MQAVMNEEQTKTFELLLSKLDNIKTANDPDFDNAVVFEGDSVDGSALGYIEVDGKVTWIVGG